MNGWRCRDCGGANERVLVPPTVGTVETEEGAERELTEVARCCGVCRVALRRGQSSMSCVECGMSVHKKCCGLSRWERENGAAWRCERCHVGSSRRRDVDEVAETERLPAGKCDVCRRLRRRGQGICCSMCKRILHVKCAELGSRGRAAGIDRSSWECVACVKQQRERERERTVGSDEPLRNQTGDDSGSIVAMQWNCDHLSSKIPELEGWLRKNGVDVAMVQETKLRDEDGAVCVRGYDVVRRDRWRGGRSRYSRGGGLVTLVRRGWAYREIACGVERDSALEALCLEVVSLLGVVWKVLNVYVPPESVTGVREDMLDCLRVNGSDENWLVCGDFNSHHRVWDPFVTANARGLQVMNWSEESELMLLNDGSATRVGRGTAGESAPDVTFCSTRLFERLEWRVIRELGSDHFPILIQGGTSGGAQDKGVLVWDWGGACWEKFQEEIRQGLAAVSWGGVECGGI